MSCLDRGLVMQRLGPPNNISKAAIRKLVKHQLETREPVYAPWYRSCPQPKCSAGRATRSETAIKVGTGTGVWIPPFTIG